MQRWLRHGALRGHRVQLRHYTDERERKTPRAQWRIHRDDLEAFIGRKRGEGG